MDEWTGAEAFAELAQAATGRQFDRQPSQQVHKHMDALHCYWRLAPGCPAKLCSWQRRCATDRQCVRNGPGLAPLKGSPLHIGRALCGLVGRLAMRQLRTEGSFLIRRALGGWRHKHPQQAGEASPPPDPPRHESVFSKTAKAVLVEEDSRLGRSGGARAPPARGQAPKPPRREFTRNADSQT